MTDQLRMWIKHPQRATNHHQYFPRDALFTKTQISTQATGQGLSRGTGVEDTNIIPSHNTQGGTDTKDHQRCNNIDGHYEPQVRSQQF